MAVNTQKLLPFAQTSSAIAKYAGASSEITKVDVKNPTEEKIKNIKTKVISADKILKGTLALEKTKLDDKKKEDKKGDRKKEEKRLETKPKKKEGKKKKPKIPGTGMFDWIKNFISNIILGYFAYRLIDHLPKMIEFVKFIGPATDFLIDLGGKLLNGLVTFIDWGYKAYDATKGFMKNLFGDDGAKKFDQLAGLLNQFLNLALIVAMASSGPGIGGKPGKGLTGIKGAKGIAGRSRYGASADAARRYAQRFGRDAAVRRFGEQGVRSLGGKYARSGITNLARKGVVGALGKQGTRTALKLIKPLVRNVPLIGGIMEFVLSWMSGDPVGKAAFKGVGAGLGTWAGGALGTLMGPGIGTAIGMWVGSQGGAALGGLLYDAIFKGKEPKGGSGNVQGRAKGGQVTRGGERISGARRRIRAKKTRILPRKPTEEKVELPTNSRAKFLGIDLKNPQVEKTAEIGTELGKTDYFGPILAVTSKVLLGEELKQKDYENVGRGINLLLYNGFTQDELKGGIAAAFAEGGMVDKSIMDMEGSVKVTNWVAKTFKESIETELKKSLKKIEETQTKQKTSQESPPPDSATGYSGTGLAGGAVAPSELYKEIGADLEQWNIYRNSVALIESNGNYSIPGGSGMHYDGRYQMGAAAKKDGSRVAGVDYPGHSDDPNASVRVNYRNNPELQETIFTGFTVANHRYLMRNSKYASASVERKLEVLGYAHNQGMGGAENWLNTGQVGADGFGTKGTAYTDLIKKNFLAKRRGQELEVAGGAIDIPSASPAQTTDPKDLKVGKKGEIYLHWTAGGGTAAFPNKYHSTFLADGSKVQKVPYSQFRTPEGHTAYRNSRGVGLSIAAMKNWNWGSITNKQVNAMAQEAANIAKAWGWSKSDINIKNVMTHAEAASGKDGRLALHSPPMAGAKTNPDNYGPTWWGGDGTRSDFQKLSANAKDGSGGPALRKMIQAKMEMGGPLDSKYNNSLLKNYASYESGSEESITVVVPNQTPVSSAMYGGGQMMPLPIVLGSGGDPFEFLDYQG